LSGVPKKSVTGVSADTANTRASMPGLNLWNAKRLSCGQYLVPSGFSINLRRGRNTMGIDVLLHQTKAEMMGYGEVM
jgi:hypothetical protein